jgi:hypothetical protein
VNVGGSSITGGVISVQHGGAGVKFVGGVVTTGGVSVQQGGAGVNVGGGVTAGGGAVSVQHGGAGVNVGGWINIGGIIGVNTQQGGAGSKAFATIGLVMPVAYATTKPITNVASTAMTPILIDRYSLNIVCVVVFSIVN